MNRTRYGEDRQEAPGYQRSVRRYRRRTRTATSVIQKCAAEAESEMLCVERASDVKGHDGDARE